jgi:cob(I)alamin adenosyltransferase
MAEKTKQGLIQIYTGDGKGKTTAALGLALRAAGRGLKVCFIQFCKGETSGEHLFIDKYPAFELLHPGAGNIFTSPEPQLKREAQETLILVEEKIASGRYDFIVLDEINIAVYRGFLTIEQVLTVLDKKPATLELVLTGRYAPVDLVKRADLVTEMLAIKHPFDQGLPARSGIEY